MRTFRLTPSYTRSGAIGVELSYSTCVLPSVRPVASGARSGFIAGWSLEGRVGTHIAGNMLAKEDVLDMKQLLFGCPWIRGKRVLLS